MPWTAADAPSHNKKTKGKPELQKAWAKAANAALEQYGDDGKAIATANATVDKMTEKDKRDEIETEPIGAFDIYKRDGMLALASPTSFDPKTREADAVISTGARVRRRDFYDEYDEVLDMGTGAIRLGRLNQGAAILDSHNWHRGIEAMLGGIVPGSARIEGGRLVARIRFSQHSELARRVMGDLKDGIQFPLSAGYKVHKFSVDERSSPPTRMITDWEPVEVSLVTVAAESEGTGIRGELRSRSSANKETIMAEKPTRRVGEADAEFSARIAEYFRAVEPIEGENDTAFNKRVADYIALRQGQEESSEKTEEEKKKKKKAAGGDDDDDADDTKRAAAPPPNVAAEILAIGRQANMSLEEIERGLRENCTPEQFRQRAFDALVGRQQSVNGANGGDAVQVNDTIEVGMDRALTGRAAAMSDALCVRMLSAHRVPAITTQGQKEWAELRGLVDRVSQSWRIVDGKERPTDPRVTQYLGMSMVEMAAECLNYRPRGLITMAKAGDIMMRAFHSTSDFPGMFENALNKSLLARYQLAMPTYRELAVERTFNDFRPHPQVRAGDPPMLQPLTETGELRAGTTQESREVISVKPYGITFSISRQMIVNDDLGAIDQVLGAWGGLVLVFENTTFFQMFNSNPTLLQDVLPVFAFGNITIPPAAAVGHNNFADTFAHAGNVPSIATIGAGRQSLRQMKSLGGYYLNVPPAIILTGPMQETVADQMVTAISPTLTTSVNPFSGRLRSKADANITTADWYIFCEPTQLPCFVYGFLAGATGPRVRTDEPFGVQGIRMSLEHDFGVGAIDYRGVYRNCGLTS